MLYRLILILLILTNWGQAYAVEDVGLVIKIKGKAVKARPLQNLEFKLKLKSKVYAGEEIRTFDNSFVKIEFKDKTSLVLGPKSKAFVKKFNLKPKRVTVYELLKGRIRAEIKRKKEKGERIEFKNRNVAIGVRGTSFLANIYPVKSTLSTDVLLLKGSVGTTLSAYSGKPLSSVLKPGQMMNTSQVSKAGNFLSIKNLSSKNLERLLSSEDSFLPNLLDINGNARDIEKLLDNQFKKVKKKLIKKIPKPKAVVERKNEEGVGISIKKETKSSDPKDNTNSTNINIGL